MWKPITDPGPWQLFLRRKDNLGAPLMEVRKKYLQEQLSFENHLSYINTLDAISLSSSPAGGRSPSIYPDFITVEFFDSGVSQGTSIYKKVLDLFRQPIKLVNHIQRRVEYRNLPGVECDYKSIYYEIIETQRPTLTGWYWREYPCGGKQNTLSGPQTTLPYGTYGVTSGLGEGYVVTP